MFQQVVGLGAFYPAKRVSLTLQDCCWALNDCAIGLRTTVPFHTRHLGRGDDVCRGAEIAAWVMTRRMTHTSHHRGKQLALLRMFGREDKATMVQPPIWVT
jgi:hypothetical protein